MKAVMAGWTMGYGMAIVSTVAMAYLAFRARTGGVLEKWVDPEVSSALLAVPIFMGMTLTWTMFGLILGSAYEVGNFKHHAGALGAPSMPFMVAMFGVAWLPLPPLLIFFRREWKLWVAMSVVFVGLFGWCMPYLAAR